MSTGSAPVRGALFVYAVVLLYAGVVAAETFVETSTAPFRVRWLSDIGSESAGTDRAMSAPRRDDVLARVPGAAYVLAIENGSAFKRRRMAADYSMVYGLAWSTEGDVVIAADDGSVSLWSRPSSGDGHSLRWRNDLGERAASVGWEGGDTVWVGTRQNRLIGLSATDGATRWSASIGGRAEAPPLHVKDSLFVATKGQTLERLDATTGKAKWSVELPGPANHPPVAAGPDSILVATRNGHLLAVRADTGETSWTAELGSRLSGAPVATADFAAAATEDGAIRAFDLSGEPLWTTENVGGERTDLLLHERMAEPSRLIAVSTNLAILDISTGEILNAYPAGAEQDIEQRFMDAMLEGGRPYSEGEKTTILERESFPIRGRLFGQAHLFDDNLVFGTEEGWVYWFDPGSLRPLCRYRAGQRAKDVPVWAPKTLVAAANEAVFGLDPSSGNTLWRRDVGPVTQIAAGETIAIVGEDRIDVLDPGTGARQWSARGDYRAIAPLDDHGWLAFGRRGVLQILDASGTALGSPTDSLHSIDAVTAMGDRRWAIASHDGDVSAADWQEADVLEWPIWNAHVDGPVEALYFSGSTLIVAGQDRLVGLSSIDGSSTWELPLAEGEVAMVSDRVFVSDGNVLRLYAPDDGTLVKELPVESTVVGATLVDDTIVWLDASGTAHRAPLAGDGAEESADLGDPLSRASFEDGMFLVTTDAGEVGLVELVAPAGLTLSQPQ